MSKHATVFKNAAVRCGKNAACLLFVVPLPSKYPVSQNNFTKLVL